MPHVLELIKAEPTKWLDILQEKYKIDVTREGDLVSLKYNQFESPMAEPIVQECRGMVVCTRRNLILAWPYNKFWNHGESLAATVDWNTARVMEKLDGSLMILFHDPEHTERDGWRVATSGHPTAGGKFGTSDETFAQAFWRVWDELGMKVPHAWDYGVTFIFEFCAEPNRVVVKHSKPRIVLHGLRETDQTLNLGNLWEEYDYSNFEMFSTDYNWEIVKTYPLDTIDACLSAVEALNPVETEGFVVVDASFNRVKIKSPRYVALHHMKGEFSHRRAIELWLSGETSELIAHFPDLADTINEVSDKLDRFAGMATSHIIHAKRALTEHTFETQTSERKAYAELVKHTPWSSVAFKLFGSTPENITVDKVKQTMRDFPVSTLEKYLESI